MKHRQTKTPAGPQPAPGSLSDHINQNIESVVALRKQEWATTTPSQRRLERVSRVVGRPLYLVFLLWLVALWVMINSGAPFCTLRLSTRRPSRCSMDC
jgi:uncharacterized membrane protein